MGCHVRLQIASLRTNQTFHLKLPRLRTSSHEPGVSNFLESQYSIGTSLDPARSPTRFRHGSQVILCYRLCYLTNSESLWWAISTPAHLHRYGFFFNHIFIMLILERLVLSVACLGLVKAQSDKLELKWSYGKSPPVYPSRKFTQNNKAIVGINNSSSFGHRDGRVGRCLRKSEVHVGHTGLRGESQSDHRIHWLYWLLGYKWWSSKHQVSWAVSARWTFGGSNNGLDQLVSCTALYRSFMESNACK